MRNLRKIAVSCAACLALSNFNMSYFAINVSAEVNEQVEIPPTPLIDDQGIPYYSYNGMLFRLVEKQRTDLNEEAWSWKIIGVEEGIPDNLIIPDKIGDYPVTEIAHDAFSECNVIKSVIIPSSISGVSYSAFENCLSLEKVVINGGEWIDAHAFYDCKSLKQIEIPVSIQEIDEFAFYNTPWLAEKQAENPCVVVNHILIDGSACSGVVQISNDVLSIAPYAFEENESISEVVLSEGVISIGDSAFAFEDEKCNLIRITIPRSVTKIVYTAFSGCKGMIIRGYRTSYAETFANEHGFQFEDIESIGTQIITEPVEKEQESGDFDGDGEIGVADAQNVLSVYTKTLSGGQSALTDAQRKACDVNGDGAVDVADAQLILQYYVKNTLSHTPTDWSELIPK